jgi:hypothetical protein
VDFVTGEKLCVAAIFASLDGIHPFFYRAAPDCLVRANALTLRETEASGENG